MIGGDAYEMVMFTQRFNGGIYSNEDVVTDHNLRHIKRLINYKHVDNREFKVKCSICKKSEKIKNIQELDTFIEEHNKCKKSNGIVNNLLVILGLVSKLKIF